MIETCKVVARYFERVNGGYRAEVYGCASGGAGEYTLPLSVSGKDLETAKANLLDLARRECVPEFKIDEWEETMICPCHYNHHIGSTCGCCGQVG